MRRRLLTILLFLLLGAVVNVGVTWGCAVENQDKLTTMLTHPAWSPRRSIEYRGWTLCVQSRAGSVRAVAEKSYSSSASFAVAVPNGAFPSWVSISELPYLAPRAYPSGIVEGLCDLAHGFPAVSMWHPFTTHTEVWPAAGSWHFRQWHLPLNLVWPGFAINTLFYAAILWLLIPGPFALRRFLRLRRGLCPKCAYPMGESAVCTE